MVKDKDTEKRIIEAARRVFLRKGMVGARMQEIADEAGINKALLHYYFRSKERLFDYILEEVIVQISTGIKGIFEKDLVVIDRLLSLVDIYMDVLLENKYLPLFILNEINQNPERFAGLLREHVVPNMGALVEQVQRETAQGLIRPVHPLHMFLNVLGMVIFPFAINPLLAKVLEGPMQGFAAHILEERKAVVKDFIIHALTPEKS